MYELTEGSLDQIMKGVEVEKPILQVLGHKKLASSSSSERYRLLLSDGLCTNSFAMLATQLNSMITDNILTDFSICEIDRYAISTVNNSGVQKRVMVILSMNLKVPGHEVGHKIGSPVSVECSAVPPDAVPPSPSATAKAASEMKTTASTTSMSGIATTPLCMLTPYLNRWVIKVCVSGKSGIRTWSNSRGDGKLFSMDLVDDTSEVRCTAFRDLCDKYFDIIEVGKVYYISRCQVKPANKQFNHLKSDYELVMNADTEVVLCLEDAKELPRIKFNFTPINEIENKPAGEIIEIMGILKNKGDMITFTARTTGKEFKKRDITLFDESNTAVTITLWGDDAVNFNAEEDQIVAIKPARVAEFNGAKNLSTINSSLVKVEPDIPEAHKLRGWYDSIGRSQEIRNLSKSAGGASGACPELALLEVMKQLANDDIDTYETKVCLSFVRSENAVYKACPTEGCNKKVIDQDNQMYRCEKCGREYPNFKYRLLLNVILCDWGEQIWATVFNEAAEKLLGTTAAELGELMANDPNAYNNKLQENLHSDFIARIRVKKDTFGDQPRNINICTNITPVDYKALGYQCVNSIKKLANISTT